MLRFIVFFILFYFILIYFILFYFILLHFNLYIVFKSDHKRAPCKRVKNYVRIMHRIII